MSRHIRMLSKTNIYHVMIRGNEKKNIFLDDDDRMSFINILRIKRKESGFLVYGYCLMDNHVHLLINAGEEGIAKVMKRIGVSYVIYFNKKYDRIGHLLQDRFKSEIIDSDAYLLTALRYIHNNPIKACIVRYAGEYKWSSYNLITGDKRDNLLETDTVLKMFSNDTKRAKALFSEFNVDWTNDKFMDYEDFELEERSKDEDEKAVAIIKDCLKHHKASMEALQEDKKYQELRNEIILKIKEETGLSIRRIAMLLCVNRGVVQKLLRKTP